MILKTLDDRVSNDLTVLASLLEETTDRALQDKINLEMKKIRAGLRGERDVAHFLDHAYRNDDDIIVLHDIRLELDDGKSPNPLVAQIDHVVITRYRTIYLLETKAMLGNIERDENGDWYQYYGGGRNKKKLPCPIAQGDRHCRIVSQVMAGSQAKEVRPVMIVMNTTEVNAPKGQNEDFHIVAAEKFPEWLKLRPLVMPSSYSIEDSNKSGPLNDDEMRGLAFRFIQAHTPKAFDWRGRFGMRQASIPETKKPQGKGRTEKKPAAPTRQEIIHDRYAGKNFGQQRLDLPGGAVFITRQEDDMRTVTAEGPDELRRHVSRMCLEIVPEDNWNPIGRFWLMNFDQAKRLQRAIENRPKVDTEARDPVPDTLPPAGGASILREVKSRLPYPLFEFNTADGLVRVIKLPEDNYAIRTDFVEMVDERVEAVCTEHNAGWYNDERGNWMIPHNPPELIERVCRAIKAFQHPLAEPARGRAGR